MYIHYTMYVRLFCTCIVNSWSLTGSTGVVGHCGTSSAQTTEAILVW